MPSLIEACREAGIQPRNIIWGWSARDERSPAVILQLWQGTKQWREPRLAARVEGAFRYYTCTKTEVEEWRNSNARLGKPPFEDMLGWQWWKLDLEYAKHANAPVRFIIVLYRMPEGVEVEVDDDSLGISEATFRKDWIGRVTYIDVETGEHEIALLRA